VVETVITEERKKTLSLPAPTQLLSLPLLEQEAAAVVNEPEAISIPEELQTEIFLNEASAERKEAFNKFLEDSQINLSQLDPSFVSMLITFFSTAPTINKDTLSHAMSEYILTHDLAFDNFDTMVLHNL
jgi:hypothetical protein